MGINTKNIAMGEMIPQCNECGICLCWGIDEIEYLTWREFWEEWTCRDCNPNYKGAYKNYKQTHK